MSKKINRYVFAVICTTVFYVPAIGIAAESSGGSLLDQIGIDPQTVFLQAIGFAIVLFVLNKFVFGRVGGLLEERQNDITSRMNKLEADQSELDRLNAETRQRLNAIESESQAKIQAAIEEGNVERQSIVDRARREASVELERARAEIQREKEDAILELRGVVAELAIDAASKIINQTLDPEKHQHIIDEAIQRLPAASQN
jgi:F-type H+-transporting ATPase subunit b